MRILSGRKGKMPSKFQWTGVLLLLAAGVAGCGKAKPIRYYQINYPSLSSAGPEQTNVNLLVRVFFSSHLYREDRIVYGGTTPQMGTYTYERWSAPPIDMLQDAMVRGLRTSGRFNSVTALRSDSNGDFILTGHLYDFKEISGTEIVARINFDAELRELKTGKIVWSHTYNHDEPSQGTGVSAVAAAMDKNVQLSVKEVEAGLGEFFRTRKAQ